MNGKIIENDIIGHRKLLEDAEAKGLDKVNLPISWIQDLLNEIEVLRRHLLTKQHVAVSTVPYGTAKQYAELQDSFDNKRKNKEPLCD